MLHVDKSVQESAIRMGAIKKKNGNMVLRIGASVHLYNVHVSPLNT